MTLESVFIVPYNLTLELNITCDDLRVVFGKGIDYTVRAQGDLKSIGGVGSMCLLGIGSHPFSASTPSAEELTTLRKVIAPWPPSAAKER